MQKTKKKENGITLIALVVTVIVILILASVTLNILFDEGLIDKTHEAANSVNYSQDNEMTQLNVLMGYIRNGTGYTPGSGTSGGGSGGNTSGGGSGGSGSSGGGTIVSGNTGGEAEYNPGIYPTDGSWDEGKRVNSPKLLDGMTGVYWDSNGNEITVIEDNAGNWYDYSNQKWANAKTSDGSYWVWIPRFAYRITSGCKTGSTGTIMISFLQGTSDLDSSGSTLSRIYPAVSSGTMANYVIHPAFTNGTDNNFKNGEWDAEIPGFWVAKYALSRADSTSVNIGNIATFKSVPNRRIATNITIGNAYTYGINYDSSKNSHITKNSERGALYYLTISGYGVNGEQPLENSCSGFVSGAGAGIDASTGYYINSSYDYNLQNFYQKYSYNTPAGKLTSSTGNMSGVYDLFTIWDKSEFTSAYIPEGTTWSTGPSTGQTTGLSAGSSFATVTTRNETAYQTASTKYCTVYPTGQLTISAEPYTRTFYLTYSTSYTSQAISMRVPGTWSYDADAWTTTANSYMYGDSVLETRGWWFGLGYNTATVSSTASSQNAITAYVGSLKNNFDVDDYFINNIGTISINTGGVFFGGVETTSQTMVMGIPSSRTISLSRTVRTNVPNNYTTSAYRYSSNTAYNNYYWFNFGVTLNNNIYNVNSDPRGDMYATYTTSFKNNTNICNLSYSTWDVERMVINVPNVNVTYGNYILNGSRVKHSFSIEYQYVDYSNYSNATIFNIYRNTCLNDFIINSGLGNYTYTPGQALYNYSNANGFYTNGQAAERSTPSVSSVPKTSYYLYSTSVLRFVLI